MLGICVVESASEMSDERRVAVFIDSLPPFNIAALPDHHVSSSFSRQVQWLVVDGGGGLT